jgi:putative flippase GtrA
MSHADKARSAMAGVSIRYLVVIGCGWIVDNFMFLLAVGSLGIALAVMVGRLAGALSGYALHRLVTFPERIRGERSRRREIAVYVAAWIFAYLLTALGTTWLTNHWDIAPLLAKVAVELIVVPANFIVLSRYAFA